MGMPDPYDSFDAYEREKAREERLREKEGYEDMKADMDWAERRTGAQAEGINEPL